jgi:hypothetical protein
MWAENFMSWSRDIAVTAEKLAEIGDEKILDELHADCFFGSLCDD